MRAVTTMPPLDLIRANEDKRRCRCGNIALLSVGLDMSNVDVKSRNIFYFTHRWPSIAVGISLKWHAVCVVPSFFASDAVRRTVRYNSK